MARTGVTAEEVATAVESLQSAGLAEPSIRMIRQKLGRGSLTTLARHKRELELQAREQGVGTLPDAVEESLRSIAETLWVELSEAADAVINKRDESAEERENAATKRIAQAMEELYAKDQNVDLVKQTLAERDKRIAALDRELKSAVNEKQDALVVAAKAEEKLEGKEQQIDALKKSAATAAVTAEKEEKAHKQEMREVQEAHERQEKEHRAEVAAVQGELDASRKEVAESQAELKSMRASIEKETKRWEKERAAIEKKLAVSDRALSDSQKALKIAEKSDESANVLLRQFKADLSALQKENQGLLAEQRELDKRNGALEMEVAKLVDQKKGSQKVWKDRLKEKDGVIGELRRVVGGKE